MGCEHESVKVWSYNNRCVKDGEILVGRCIQMDLHKLMAEEVSLYMVVSIGDQQDALISFAGHGSKYGFIADNSSDTAISPDSVHPPYHLSAVRAYSCLSSTDIPGNVVLANGTIPTSSWKSHVSSNGTFFGYSGYVNWISQLWQEVSINEDSE